MAVHVFHAKKSIIIIIIIIINFIGNSNIYRKNKIQSTPKKLCNGSKDEK